MKKSDDRERNNSEKRDEKTLRVNFLLGDVPSLHPQISPKRKELDITVTKTPKKLPYVPTEEEIKRYYEVVWNAKNFQNMLIIKMLLYTGVRVSELINIKLSDIDLDAFQIKIIEGKGKKDRIVPFSQSFRETLAMHIEKMKNNNGKYLFESNRRKKNIQTAP